MDITLTEKQMKKLQNAADINAIQVVMAQYVSCLSKMDASGIFDKLFAQNDPDVRLEIEESGAYVGPEHVRAFLTKLDEYFADASDKRGWMDLEHLCTPYIVINRDGTKARATWSLFAPESKWAMPNPGSTRELTALWFCGKYYCEFVKTDDGWKIEKLQKIAFLRSPFLLGWRRQPDCRRFPVFAGITPDCPPRYYTYNADYVCASGGKEWGPYIPETIDF